MDGGANAEERISMVFRVRTPLARVLMRDGRFSDNDASRAWTRQIFNCFNTVMMKAVELRSIEGRKGTT